MLNLMEFHDTMVDWDQRIKGLESPRQENSISNFTVKMTI